MDKPFIIHCLKCGWKETSTGISSDLAHLYEIKNHCSNCGKTRRFRCPKCANPAKMLRKNGRVG